MESLKPLLPLKKGGREGFLAGPFQSAKMLRENNSYGSEFSKTTGTRDKAKGTRFKAQGSLNQKPET